MTAVDKNRQSALAREEYRRVRIQRAQELLVLKPSVIDAVLDAEGRLDGPKIKQFGMKLNIPLWDNYAEYPGDGTFPPDEDTLELFMAPGHTPDEADFVSVLGPLIFTGGFAASYTGDFIVPLSALLPEGPWSFKYKLIIYTGQPDESSPVALISDITKPYEHTSPPEPPPMEFAVADKWITDANVGAISGTIPVYVGGDQAPGDTVVYWYAKAPLPEDPATLPPVSGPITIGADRKVPFPRDYIIANGDGEFYIIYVLFDSHKNRSNLSGYTKLDVTLGALPTNLQKPKVPVAADGAVIDQETAAGPVLVEIDRYDGWKAGDMVHASWGGVPLEPYRVGTEQPILILIDVPASTMKAEYGNVSAGEKDVVVGYSVKRGEVVFGPSADIFKTNFSLIGPPRPDPDPDWPDSPNPALLEGVVTGKSGVGGDDELVRDDEGESATFTFNLYTPVTAGETIEFFWNGELVTEATFTITTESAGAEVFVFIPWSYIFAAGKGRIPVHYTIGGPNVPVANRQKSKVTTVVVDAISVNPVAPKFKALDTDPPARFLICDHLDGPDHALVVTVPDLSSYDIIDGEVTLRWTPYSGRFGTTPISSAIKTETITLGDAGFPATGFEWRIEPYSTHIAPTYDPADEREANAVVTYSFEMVGETGPITSLEAKSWIAMFDGSGACPIP
ncbi:hypothetical protein [Pseudomonas sp. PD9R]|uniref:hypothetical protein n=1 Tax=Pseudomonas sp. PD9R TaxID=2853534 RepID=UPI001C464506|nr:hypothetical protein [Pseudomonas sp. PD9R]MBV6823778.1 hypothetical protein [Pseudomonas sp. PD9R]